MRQQPGINKIVVKPPVYEKLIFKLSYPMNYSILDPLIEI